MAQTLLNSKKHVTLSVGLPIIERHFRSLYETPNDNVRDTYEESETPEHEITLALDDILLAIKKISIDTSPGLDKIIMRTVRQVKCVEAILNISKIMLMWNYVPISFRTGRTILIYL